MSAVAVDAAPGLLAALEQEVGALLAVPVQRKLAAFDAGAAFLRSSAGQPARAGLIDELVAAGYPASSARREVDALPAILSRGYLTAVVDDQAALPGGRSLLDGAAVPVGSGASLAGFPVGPVVVIGSGNAFLPAVLVSVQALLASCPVVLRGSRMNQRVLQRLVDALALAGPELRSLLSYLHLVFFDHRDSDGARQLRELLRTGPFGAGVFWGGREMLDELLPVFASNPRHPLPLPMEPLTGVALITESYVFQAAHSTRQAADGLADAMTAFGQQLCSSPTEAYFVGRHDRLHEFAGELAGALERSAEAGSRTLTATRAMQLDRVRDRCEDAGSTVLTPPGGGSNWTVVVSEEESVFTRLPASLCPGIHDRFGFLELVSVPNLNAAAERISALPAAPCHAGIKQVQTILRLAERQQSEALVSLLRHRGGVFRVVPCEHVVERHPLEPYDGQHFLSAFTRRTVII